MANIAFLGTGVMGAAMAGRLIDAGETLSVYNRTVEKTRPLVEAGATLARTPRDAAAGADVLIAMVGDDGASENVWLGDDGALAGAMAPGALAIECSTLSHDWVVDLSRICTDHGLTYIDCPVTGYPHMAAAGELTLFVGGAADDLARARSILEQMSVEIIHFGGIGSGTAYKLMVNLMGSVQIAAAAEGLLTAEKAGLDLETVAYALSKGAAASPQVTRNSQRMVAADHDENITFSGAWRLKDTLYGLKLAEKVGQNARLGKVAGEIYRKLVDDGLGDLNETKVIDLLRARN
jgi:3-hydroxyisobutyrate dehydrogenase